MKLSELAKYIYLQQREFKQRIRAFWDVCRAGNLYLVEWDDPDNIDFDHNTIYLHAEYHDNIGDPIYATFAIDWKDLDLSVEQFRIKRMNQDRERRRLLEQKELERQQKRTLFKQMLN